MTDLRRTVYGVAIALAVTLVAQAIGRARREPQPQEIVVAFFTHFEGSVQVKKVGTLEWMDATPATNLQVGDLVRTGQRARAEILFPDGTRFVVRPDSLIRIDSMSPGQDSYPRVVPLR